MGNMVPNVYAKFNYDRLRIDKALGNFRKYDNNNNNNNNNNVPSAGPKNLRISVSHRDMRDAV